MVAISKMRGVSPPIRVALKAVGINTSSRLLAVAARLEDRLILASSRNIDLVYLTELVQRADLARIGGIGATSGRMLEMLGIRDVASLARQTPGALASGLGELNDRLRVTRRTPNLAEVTAWVQQARQLPKLVSYTPQEREVAR
jgi:hypothetical protein